MATYGAKRPSLRRRIKHHTIGQVYLRRAAKLAAAGYLIGYDAVSWGNIPQGGRYALGYDDGFYAWPAAAWQRFASWGMVLGHIAVNPNHNLGQILDCETGDATPAQCPGWVAMRRRAGVDPTVYCSAAIWGQVRDAFLRQGVPEPHYWIAAYPGIGPTVYSGSVAHQYADTGLIDISVVLPTGWPGIDSVAPPKPPPPPPPHREDHDMYKSLAPGENCTMPLAIFAKGVVILTADDSGKHSGQTGVPVRAAIRDKDKPWAPLLGAWRGSDPGLGPDPFVAWYDTAGEATWISTDGTGGEVVIENLDDAGRARVGIDPHRFPSGNNLGVCVTW